MPGEHFPQKIVAGAAFGADPAALQIGDALSSGLNGLEDVPVGLCAAEANDHALRLSLNIIQRYDKCHMRR
jgi:hypothetical protein